MKPLTLIIRAAGINCDRELAHAFELAGARTRSVHLNALIADPAPIHQAQLIGVPGGFSYGDDIAAGRIFANRVRHRLWQPLLQALARGTPIIGICNGFQVLTKMGLLPDPPAPTPAPGKAPEESDAAGEPAPIPEGGAGQTATLADNTCGRFIDRWVSLRAEPESVCIWTRGLESFDLPIAHGEGRFVPASDALLERWRRGGQIALRYAGPGDGVAFPGNPNGSVDDIAGVCDPSGLVLGLMPHPERNVHPTHHPHWSRRAAEALAQTPAGLRFFQNAVEHVRAGQSVAVG